MFQKNSKHRTWLGFSFDVNLHRQLEATSRCVQRLIAALYCTLWPCKVQMEQGRVPGTPLFGDDGLTLEGVVRGSKVSRVSRGGNPPGTSTVKSHVLRVGLGRVLCLPGLFCLV